MKYNATQCVFTVKIYNIYNKFRNIQWTNSRTVVVNVRRERNAILHSTVLSSCYIGLFKVE